MSNLKASLILIAVIGTTLAIAQPSQAFPFDRVDPSRFDRDRDNVPPPIRRAIRRERRDNYRDQWRDRDERRFDRFDRERRDLPPPVRELRREIRRDAIRDAIEDRFDD